MKCRRHRIEKQKRIREVGGKEVVEYRCQECHNGYQRKWRRRKKAMSKEGPVPVLAEPERARGEQSQLSGEAREGNNVGPQSVCSADSRGGQILSHVSAIPVNPKLCSVRLSGGGEEVEVVVGRNERLWLGCPLFVRQSQDYPGFYELVGELPRGRWDRAYLEGFK